MTEIHDIVSVELISDHGLRVTFDDGEVREFDLQGQLDGSVFEPLRDPREFAKVKIDKESGTVCWPSGADLDPIVIYEGTPPINAKAPRATTA